MPRNSIITLLMTFFLLGAFGLVFLRTSFFEITQLLALVGFAVFAYVKQKNIFSNLVIVYVLGVFLSCIIACFTNNTSYYYKFRASYHYIGLLSFFIPFYFGITYDEMRKILRIVSIAFCACYIYQYEARSFLFSIDNTIFEHNEIRPRMVGSLCGYYLFFESWSMILFNRKRIMNFLLLLLAFFPIIIQGFRSIIFCTLVSSFVMIAFSYGHWLKTIKISLFAAIFVMFVSQIPFVSDKINEMDARQESGQVFSEKDYIRNVALAYYWDNCNNDVVSFAFGTGIRSYDSNDRFENEEQQGIFMTDLGLVGLGFVLGFVPVMLLISIVILLIVKCKSIDIQFLKFCMFAILMSSIITNSEIYRVGNLILIGLILYMVWKKEDEINKITVEKRSL